MVNIGVLSLQGSVQEHMQSLSKIDDVNPVELNTLSQLENISGLILPGGESTTIGKLLIDFGLSDPIIMKVQKGMPIWGTCAGTILLAKHIADEKHVHLGLMDITVVRNAYGSQLQSFTSLDYIPSVSDTKVPLIFIRAPWIENVYDYVEVLYQINNKIVAARQKNMLVTTFHPELTDDLSFHRYFVNIVKEYMNNN